MTRRRSRWPDHGSQVRAANRARHRARKMLVAENYDRFTEIYAEVAREEGVTPLHMPPETEWLAAELERLRAHLQRRLDEQDGHHGHRMEGNDA